MKAPGLLLNGLLLAVVAAFGQGAKEQPKHALFNLDWSLCAPIQAPNLTETTEATEVRVATAVYQVFWSRTVPKRELFRVQVGRVVGRDTVKFWKYCLGGERDYNGDGVPDYYWYGGDDTSEEFLLFLSSDGNYKRVDIIKTVEKVWKQRLHKAAPDLGEVGGEYSLGETALERTATGLILQVTVEHVNFSTGERQSYRFRIVQGNFAR